MTYLLNLSYSRAWLRFKQSFSARAALSKAFKVFVLSSRRFAAWLVAEFSEELLWLDEMAAKEDGYNRKCSRMPELEEEEDLG